MRAVAVTVTCAAVLALGSACLNYMGEADAVSDTGRNSMRWVEARRALQRECRRIDVAVDGIPRPSVEAWRIHACGAPDCERTVPFERTVYVRRAADARARHEYVHVCLFASGKIDGHHAWMQRHCDFCYGSPACDSCE